MDKTKSELKEMKFYFLDFIYVPRGNPYSNFMPEPFNGVEQLDGELYSASFFSNESRARRVFDLSAASL